MKQEKKKERIKSPNKRQQPKAQFAQWGSSSLT
jgi:hypothetical protein